ncbi:chondroitin AC/alginate lyase [Mycena maculata]|uniref:Chondroitin AC/alginate lyase n=1 Tax=Mycena maculata TaxID=230809 RepID=A0AAD7KDP7_9AGAR|nr:chondroitin AC/alginate lyase [Mycena maculata]
MPFSPPVLLILALAGSTVADVTDWVNIPYLLQQSQSPSSSTSNAQTAICQNARSSAKIGPWSITNSKVASPPSGDLHDYLSWAPYHWPDCNWCTTANQRVHLVHDGNSTNTDDGSTSGDDDDNYEGEAIPNPIPAAQRRMSRVRRRPDDDAALEPSQAVAALDVPAPQAPLGTMPSLSVPQLPTGASTTSATGFAGGSAPPQAAVKTKASSSSSCTPSPTKSMPASATWTTCPYVQKDGKVNPDVRTLNGPAAINSASQSIIYNCVCCVLQQQQPGSAASDCSRNAVNAIVNFFVTPSTKMNPNMNFGQVVRGPGASGQQGTFTGILDLRGIVKIVNCLLILRAISSPDWPRTYDKNMTDWMGQYSGWLTNSDLGKSTAAKANNHASFYNAQKAAIQIGTGDNTGAIQTLSTFFANQFQDQITSSGEQPLEAVRTRPFHYRCFNLEALITLAKLGDQLGLNLWSSQSKYKATIQTAMDFVMTLDPKDEDGTEACPHAAAVSAAYGDPTGKYAAFLGRECPQYRSQSYFFYDQPGALPNAPGARTQNKRVDSPAGDVSDNIPKDWCPVQKNIPGFPSPPKDKVQLDDDIFVTCKELEPLYFPNVTPAPVDA